MHMEPPAFDIIFAGGGTTACVVAGRLTATDPSLKILIVEGGQHSRDVPIHVQPCRFVEHLTPDTTTLSAYPANPSPHLGGRSVVVTCGRAVGGGSAVNFMFYVRGAASDYDDWAAFDNKGWNFDELLPYIRKVETFTPIPGRSTTHGYSGPIHISGADIGVGKQFLDVAREYDQDRQQVDDTNDFHTPNAYGPAYQYVNPFTGRRSDAASGYLYPHADNPNLTILVGKRVKRVIIENGRATGVEYTTGGGELVAKARRLVVLSAGALGSPAILERSGIGARSVLEKNNISVLVDLPGVGENYQDHIGAFVPYYASDATETMDDIWDDPDGIPRHLNEWEKNGTGKISLNGTGAMVKLRPTPAELKSAGPALQRRWEAFFQSRPDKPMALIAAATGCPPFRSVAPGRKLICMCYFLPYPESIGSAHITCGEDVDSPLDLNLDFLTKAGDVAQLTFLYKKSRELAMRMPSYRGEVAAYHPHFPVGSLAACKETDVPVSIDAPNIMYTTEDEGAIEKFHRDKAGATWHSLGTCAMKPRDQGGVVDARLNVYGIEGLKVADMSISPSNVGNNTYSTALLIGEKAAAIIAEDLGYDTSKTSQKKFPDASTD